MNNKIKDKIITIIFLVTLIATFILNICSEDKQISITERRKLAQLPEITIKNLINGNIADKWEAYATDQFVFRDFFRSIKSFFSINILKQKDNNKLFEKDGAIYKIDYPLNEKNIEKSTDKINQVYKKYLQNMNVFYAIIPDKNYYLKDDEHLKIDYNKVKEIMNNKLVNMQYIDIWDCLELSDYYKTDLHWKQENLYNVVDRIREQMKLQKVYVQYNKKDMGDFYGTYYGQLNVKVNPDKLYILTNETIENCKTYNYENNKEGKVYQTTTSSDKYDIYLSGATPLISIENPNSKTDKQLLIFRDSFGSSIAPLFIENYNKITLIDLRYISSNLLNNYINFENQDVLFLYSTIILNQNVLK